MVAASQAANRRIVQPGRIAIARHYHSTILNRCAIRAINTAIRFHAEIGLKAVCDGLPTVYFAVRLRRALLIPTALCVRAALWLAQYIAL